MPSIGMSNLIINIELRGILAKKIMPAKLEEHTP